jgi:site-specific recombinase XerD
MMNKTKSPWNKGKKTGSKPPLTPQQVQLIKMLLASKNKNRDLVLFHLAIDSAFRGIDLVCLKVSDILVNGEIADVISITQQKTQRTVKAYLTEQTRILLQAYINAESFQSWDYLFPSKIKAGTHITVNRYRALVKDWVQMASLDAQRYGSHSLRRSKVSLIYAKTGNLRACQKLLGHASIQHTASYLGIEEAEALKVAREFEL